ncbi:MAG: ExbD/TolR family protein [Gemmatimonadaceae bacterium]
MSVGTGGSVKAEPNVVPMIDVMLVLLIIFMVVTPALAAGFTATPPEGVNLKAHPEDEETDKVLGIDQDGQYFLDKKPICPPPVDQASLTACHDALAERLTSIYDTRTIDKILYIKAHRELEYERVLDAMDIAARSGVRVVGAVSEQQPGTESTVEGDELETQP